MSLATNAGPTTDESATVVITHRVRDDKHADYEAWLNEISPACRAAPGHLDWHIVRPLSGLTATYTIIIRFDTRSHLQAWLQSTVRARLIEKAQPLFVSGDNYVISSGLDFWFQPAGSPSRVPVRWKQYLVTWSAIFPLVIAVPHAVLPILRHLGLSAHPLLTTACVTAIVVFLMVYVVMPRYTKLLQRWLFT